VGGSIGIEIRPREAALVLVGVDLDGLSDLTQVARALDAVGLLAGSVERREQDGDQQRDDADNHQQFDEGKAPRFTRVLHTKLLSGTVRRRMTACLVEKGRRNRYE